jgi:hypothetical protein
MLDTKKFKNVSETNGGREGNGMHAGLQKTWKTPRVTNTGT